MQPSQGAFYRTGKVILKEFILYTILAVPLTMIGLKEKTAVIRKYAGFNHESAGQVGLRYLHGGYMDKG